LDHACCWLAGVRLRTLSFAYAACIRWLDCPVSVPDTGQHPASVCMSSGWSPAYSIQRRSAVLDRLRLSRPAERRCMLYAQLSATSYHMLLAVRLVYAVAQHTLDVLQAACGRCIAAVRTGMLCSAVRSISTATRYCCYSSTSIHVAYLYSAYAQYRYAMLPVCGVAAVLLHHVPVVADMRHASLLSVDSSDAWCMTATASEASGAVVLSSCAPTASVYSILAACTSNIYCNHVPVRYVVAVDAAGTSATWIDTRTRVSIHGTAVLGATALAPLALCTDVHACTSTVTGVSDVV